MRRFTTSGRSAPLRWPFFQSRNVCRVTGSAHGPPAMPRACDELQANDPLVADFGQLDNKPRTKDEASLKRVSDLVTNNRFGVEAHTTLTPMRGRLYQQH